MRTLFFLLLLAITAPAADHAFAATVNPVATEAALDAMRNGGNAVDGAIAAAVTLGVVDSHNSGIGGGLFMLIRKPDGTFIAIDGRETAPAAATHDMFLKNGQGDPNLSQEGALAPAVPGWLAALDDAATHFGQLPLKRALFFAARVADAGFPPDKGFASRLEQKRAAIQRHPETAAILLQPLDDGKMRLPELAETYRQIADHGIGWFYHGPFAKKTEAWMETHGGLLTTEDFANYQVQHREPLHTTYRGYDIIGFPPSSSGGVHVAQILNILENFDLHSMGEGSADFIHVVSEAMKLAFADRAWWLGDPDFASVPRGLAEKAYAKMLAAKIDLQHASAKPAHGEPPDAGVFGKHTTHFSVADSDGWWVGCTATINTTWGSLVTIPGTGVILNDEMDDFSIQPGVPNAFGLVGAEANSVAARKRPLSSMSPTIVLKDGKPLLVVGAAGGPTIISQALLAIVRTIDFGLSPSEALARPRFHHQWRPETLRIERSVPEKIRAELERRGHQLEVVGSLGVSQAVGLDATGHFQGAADPRAGGSSAGF